MSNLVDWLDQDLSGLVNPSDDYQVVSAIASQMDFGEPELTDSIEITFTVTGRDGIYTVELPLGGFRVFENGLDLTSEAKIIDALWEL